MKLLVREEMPSLIVIDQDPSMRQHHLALPDRPDLLNLKADLLSSQGQIPPAIWALVVCKHQS